MLRGPDVLRTPVAVGFGVVAVLVVAAAAVPPLADWHVHPLLVGGNAPLAAYWQPRVGPGTLPAVVLAIVAARFGPGIAGRLGFGRLLLAAYLAGLGWLFSLALVDGWAGVAHILDRPAEYLITARRTPDVGTAVRDYIARIPHVWPTHIAGHPPGALLVFVGLVRLGLGGSSAAAVVVVVVAASTPLAVLVTLRRLDAEQAARRAAPFLVFGPAAIWTAVSADALFAAVAAWGLALCAVAATSRGVPCAAAALAAGTVLGYCCFLSYGLPLLALPALAVLVLARTARPLPWIAGAAAAVFAAFDLAGFAWWAALPVLRARYYAGIASLRPAAYWGWADFAALALSAGPVVGPALATVGYGVVRRRRAVPSGTGTDRSRQVVSGLGLSAAAAVVLADLSFMSKAEVERIWLPFVPWLLVPTAVLPDRWRRVGLGVQVATAVAIQTLLHTRW